MGAAFAFGRRGFSRLLAGALAGAALPAGFWGCSTLAPGGGPFQSSESRSGLIRSTGPRSSLVRPPALRHGDTVGLIAPGGFIEDAGIEKCVRNLKAMGFRVKPGENLRAVRGNYAGTTAQRLEDLHAMFLDRDVKAVWAARGGSGCAALLPHIRYDALRANPKALVGFSDITALHLAIHRHAGIVTFHGPAAITAMSDYSVRQLRAVLMEPRPEYPIAMAEGNRLRAQSLPHYAMRTFRHGTAEGPLVGGNLSVVSSLVGTPFAAELAGSLVFLEETGEAPYRIDRMLTQLEQSQGLGNAAAILLGVFTRSNVAPGEAALTLEQTLEDHLGSLPVPAAYGYSFGHIADHFTIPVGVRARLDTREQTLTLLEPAVSA